MQAAEIALRILSQKDAAVYAVENSRSRPVFDYHQLVRFNIPMNHLPANSLFINQPVSFIQQHHDLLVPGLIVAVLLMAIITILTISNIRIRSSRSMLEKSEEKYRTVFENMAQGAFYQRADGKLIDCNPAVLEMFGLSPDQFMGKTSMDPNWKVIHEDGSDLPGDQHPSMEALRTGKPVKGAIAGVFNPRKKDYVWLTINAIPLLMSGKDQPDMVFVTLHDITERKRAEEALRESESQLRKAQEITHIGHFKFNPATGLVIGSDELFRIFGLQRDALRFSNFTASVHPDQREFVESTIQNAVDQASGYNIEHYLLLKDGTIKYVNAIGEVAPSSPDCQPLLVGTVQDITDRKRAEEEREKLQIQLNQAQKMESIGSLAGGIAHDLNNILFPISGLSEMLLDEIPPDNPAHESIEQIHKSAQRGSDLVKQILAFSRQSNPQKLPIRIQPILKEALKLARATIPRNIEITSHIEADCGMVSADPTQVHQIVMNLITNAYHAVEETGGTIHIELKETEFEKDELPFHAISSGKYACITVSDTGTGIDQTLIDKIFDPYFTTKEQGKGTGLGLSVVHGIVKEHGGDIRVYSEVGKGTNFHVYLPLLEDARDSKTAADPRKYPTGCERILLVDDEEPIVHMEQMMLEKLGYQDTVRTSSPDALAAFKADPDNFDLVISDRGMPNMTGEQLARELISIRPGIPIILCTGFSDENDEQRAKAMGIKGFLMKPVATGDLAAMVRKVLDGLDGDVSITPVLSRGG